VVIAQILANRDSKIVANQPKMSIDGIYYWEQMALDLLLVAQVLE
jgi:hypothetical protein